VNLFITGATGFLGSHFVNAAHEKSHNLYCIRRKKSKCRIKLNKEPTWLNGDMSANWSNELGKCDAFIHFAAEGINKQVSYKQLIETNVINSIKIINDAIKSGICKFIIMGTYWEYGSSENAYAASKTALYVLCKQIAIERRIKLNYLRIGQIYGEGESSNRLWPSLRNAAKNGDDISLTTGSQIRDFVPVEFAAKKILDFLEFKDVENGSPKVSNIGTGRSQSLRNFAEYWWDKWGARGKLKFGDIKNRENEIMRFVPEI
jgi:nucleoside-diphosphate-sugar epimerase